MKSLLLGFLCTIAWAFTLPAQSDTFQLTLCSQFWATNIPGPSWYFLPTAGNPTIGGYQPDSICGSLKFVPANSADSYCPQAESSQQDFANGLTIKDLLLLGKHIIGFEPLQFNEQKFAADLNGSGSITLFDLTLLRQLLLGQTDTLPANRSWRLIFENQTLPNPADPFGNTCPGYTYTPPATQGEALFLSIKLGDLDGDAQPDGQYQVPQDFSPVEIRLPDLLLTAGAEYDIPVSIKPTWTSMGLQAGFHFDPQNLEWLSVNNGLLELTENVDYHLAANQTFRLAALLDEARVLSQGIPLFTFRVKALKDGHLSTFLPGLWDTVPALLLDFERNIHPVRLQYYGVSGLALPQAPDLLPSVSPNPFRQTATLDFHLNTASQVQLELRSVTGVWLGSVEKSCAAGDQQLVITRPEVSSPLWLFYTLRCGERVVQGKILQLP